jgi:2-polyprenyl-3-methyl-5-hydroxy-6-metoxy-1,4-benzoquinol methylase
MSSEIALQHQAEVRQRERFEFGKNWRLFLRTLDDDKIRRAEHSLQSFLGQDRLDGFSFLDIGSGSGLFSLAARRLGANVTSFDYDSDSVACTRELRRRYFKDDPNWVVAQGSVLDEKMLATLGQYDIVYSWGVLHHTGQMWRALDLVKDLVEAQGRLFIAIYNDIGATTDEWHRIKVKYNALPLPLRLPYAAKVLFREEWPQVVSLWKQGKVGAYINRWTDYPKHSTRGMDFWRDQIDWIGGLPYERATVDQILDHYMADGFEPIKTLHREASYGCNEFLFKRIGARGEIIDRPIPESNWLARREGHRLSDIEVRDGRVHARLVEPLPQRPGETLSVFIGNELGPIAEATQTGAQGVESISWPGSAPQQTTRVVGAARQTLDPPFQHIRDKMWGAAIPELEKASDSMEGQFSTLTPFIDGKQLPLGREVMDNIAAHGAGRYSHWLAYLYFAPIEDVDPNGRPIEILHRALPGTP